MKCLLDTNVVLDVLLDRSPWAADMRPIWLASYRGEITAALTATSVTNIFYIARKLIGLERARLSVHLCLDALEVLPVDASALELASSLQGSDFGDDVQIACAQHGQVDLIVTRDPAGFAASPIRCASPAQAREILASR